MIQDEDVWVDALHDRNNVAHSYNEAIALSIIRASKERYITMFEALQQEFS